MILTLLILTTPLAAQQVGGEYQTHLELLGSGTGSFLGNSVAGVGDLDGDGLADFIMGEEGAHANGLSDSGAAHVISGATGATIHSFSGGHTGDFFGLQVASAGDVDGDGLNDFLVSARKSQASGLTYTGTVSLYSGASGILMGEHIGAAVYDEFGCSMAGVGDLNGDGFGDFLVGANSADPNGLLNAGSVYLYSGATGALLRQFDGANPGDHFGHVVANAGDMNNDGFADIVIGAPSASPGGRTEAGIAYVYSGATGNLLFAFYGSDAGDRLGWSASTAGDVNGDGRADLLLGAPSTNVGGSVFLRSGFMGVLLFRFDAETAYPRTMAFGYSVAGGKDFDGDAIPDIAVGYPNYGDGLVRIFSGASGQLVQEVSSSWYSADFGSALASTGDMDGDGLEDFVVGAPGFGSMGSGIESGAVYAIRRNPFLISSANTVSATSGGSLQLELEFPDLAAQFEFKVLLSLAGTGPTTYGIDIPLTRDFLVNDSFLGNYPFASTTNLHGTLDPAGDASASFSVAAGIPISLVGRTVWFAAIANSPGQLPAFSSAAVAVEILP